MNKLLSITTLSALAFFANAASSSNEKVLTTDTSSCSDENCVVKIVVRASESSTIKSAAINQEELFKLIALECDDNQCQMMVKYLKPIKK